MISLVTVVFVVFVFVVVVVAVLLSGGGEMARVGDAALFAAVVPAIFSIREDCLYVSNCFD